MPPTNQTVRGAGVQFPNPIQLVRQSMLLLSVLALFACDGAVAPPDAPEPGVFEATTQGPAGAVPGTCWGRTVSPALIETATEQVQVTPPRVSATGEIQSLPVYRTETRQVIVTPRKDNWFETPCPEMLTPRFIETLQRALKVRGIYGGTITGALDDVTRNAMRQYQKAQGGPDSPVLALSTARSLGLIAVDRATLN